MYIGLGTIVLIIVLFLIFKRWSTRAVPRSVRGSLSWANNWPAPAGVFPQPPQQASYLVAPARDKDWSSNPNSNDDLPALVAAGDETRLPLW